MIFRIPSLFHVLFVADYDNSMNMKMPKPISTKMKPCSTHVTSSNLLSTTQRNIKA